MTSFNDFTVAAEFRDIVAGIVQTEVDKKISFRYGKVTSISADHRTVQVEFPENVGTSVTVRVADRLPRELNQVVQVMIQDGVYTLFSILGPGETQDFVGTEFTAPTPLQLSTYDQSIRADWGVVERAIKYEIQWAEDSGFTVNFANAFVVGNSYIVSGLLGNQTYYFRVRATNAYGATPGPWSTTGSIICSTGGGTIVGDGNPPENSPQAIVSSGIGFIVANWTAQTNNDPVTYDIHLSTTSGFTPGPGTLLGSTDGTSFFIRTLVDKVTPLTYGTTYYVRLIARDMDGSGPAGIQGSGTPVQVNTGDAGNIGSENIVPDGQLPGQVTGLVVTNGVGYLYAKWDYLANADALRYEVHVSTSTGFTPSANTLTVATPSTFAFIRNKGPGAGGGILDYGVTYYVKIIARDADGAGTSSSQASGTVLRVSTGDIGSLQITEALIASGAVSGLKLADLAVSNAKLAVDSIYGAVIQAGAITETKIGTDAVTTAKIMAGAVTAAEIAAGTITANELAANSVTASEIQAGAVTADKIAASAVTTEKLTVGSIGENALPNGGLEEFGTDPGGGNWAPYSWIRDPAGIPWTPATGTGSISGATSWVTDVVTSTTEAGFYLSAAQLIPVVPGESWYLAMYANTGLASGDGVYVQAHWYDAAKTWQSSTDAVSNVSGAATPAWYQGIVTVPSTARFMGVRIVFYHPNVTTAIKVGEIVARRVVVSAVIADGAITTPKIIAGAITAASGILGDLSVETAKIVNLAVTEGKIADLSVSSGKIQNLAVLDAKITSLSAAKITAGTLSADVIVGARIKTADTGSRVELNTTGLKAYNSAGALVVDIATTGTATFKGTVEGAVVRASKFYGMAMLANALKLGF